MPRLQKVLVVLSLFCILTTFAGAQEQTAAGYVPRWKVGDSWVLEATYRDLNASGETWLPPVQWMFKVRAIKEVNGTECFVIHVFPRITSMKVQAVLYLSTADMKPVKVIDVTPSKNGTVSKSERVFNSDDPEPLVTEGTLAPYDLPVFPLIRASVQSADGLDAYRGPRLKKFFRIFRIGGLKFKKTYSQRNKRPDRQFADTISAYRRGGEAFQVELTEEHPNRVLTQIWQEGQPWALSSESNLRKVRLVQPSIPDSNPQTRDGR